MASVPPEARRDRGHSDPSTASGDLGDDVLVRREEELRHMLQAADIGVCLIDLDGQIVYANTEADRLHGIALAHLDPDTLADRLTASEPPRIQRLFIDVLARAQPGSLRYRLEPPGVAPLWIDVSMNPLFAKDRTPEGVVAVLQDVTERVDSLSALEDSRNFANTVIDMVEALVMVFDPSGRIQVFNRGCELLTGLSADDVVGRSLFEALIPSDDVAVFRNELEATLDGSAQRFRNDWQNPAGETRRLDWTTTAIRTEAGDVSAVIATGVDLTEKHRLERRLSQTRRMESIGRLAGGIAHDFNNLLAVVSLRVERLRERRDDPALDHECDEIVEALDRGARLVSDLMSFSGQQRLQPESLDICEELDEMTELLVDLLGHGRDFELVRCEEPTPVFVDPNHLDQIMMNLAANAADAMPDGGTFTVRVQLESLPVATSTGKLLERDLPAGRYVRVDATDTGAGIDPRVRSRVFEPFFSTKPGSSGTGLGLSIAGGIITQSGGTVEIDSEPGRGTTVRFWLPLSDLPAELGDEPDPADGESAGEVDRWITTGAVLVVEDDPALREAIGAEVRSLGVPVLEAHDVDTAMAHGWHDIDLLITDLGLPGRSGAELAAAFRAARPDLPVLFVTAYSPQRVHDEGVELRDVLFKPFARRVLREAVARKLPTRDRR